MRWKTSLRERAFNFAAAVVALYPKLARLGPPHSDMARQLFRAASAIGAALEEGHVAASRRDMGLKHATALREARESAYWLRLVGVAAGDLEGLAPLTSEANELVAMLTTSVKKLRSDE